MRAPGSVFALCFAAERAMNAGPSLNAASRSFDRVTIPSANITSGLRASTRSSIAALSAVRSRPSR